MEVKRDESFEGWCVLELMGHRRLGGYVREATVAGASFIRIDVPAETEGAKPATQFYSPGSVYAITPVTEAMARAVAKRNQPEPVSRWELPQLQASTTRSPPAPLELDPDGFKDGFAQREFADVDGDPPDEDLDEQLDDEPERVP